MVCIQFKLVTVTLGTFTLIFHFLCDLSSKLLAGLPLSGKSQGKTKSFQGQGRVREFVKKSGKIFDIVKVSEKSGNSVFRFIVRKFSSRL